MSSRISKTFPVKRIVPESIARLMSSEDRKKYGVKTAAESLEASSRTAEKKEQALFSAWCHLNAIPCRHDRMDKRVTGNVGWPDFTLIYCGRALLLEFKVGANKPSADQQRVHGELERTGTKVIICSSAGQAIEKTRDWLVQQHLCQHHQQNLPRASGAG
jgi:hypothetical protein